MKAPSVTVESASPEKARQRGALQLETDPENVEVESLGEGAYRVAVVNVPGRFELDLARDHMSAALRVLTPPLGKGAAVTVDDIAEELARLEISHGIDQEAIQQAVDAVNAKNEPEQNVRVASGNPSKPGQAATLVWQIGESAPNAHPDARYAVKPGQMIVEKKPATSGENGRTVLGEEIEACPGEDRPFSAGDHVDVSEDGAVFSAMVYGIAERQEESVSVKPLLCVDDDRMRCTLDLFPVLADNSALCCDGIVALLKEAKIENGIQEEAIQSGLAGGEPVPAVVAAEGTRPVAGQDARIAFEFQAGPTVGALVEGTDRVDYRERGALHNVKASDLLAVKTPATPGEDGVDIFGQSVSAVHGKDASLTISQNVDVSDDGLEYRAAAEGVVCLTGGDKLGVFEEYDVRSDVDYETGNLDMDGTLKISGWIRAGFTVKASGDIIVDGGIEDASVQAEGSVRVRGGIVGAKSEGIRAGGDLEAGFVENALLEAQNDIVIHDALIGSSTLAGGRVDVTAGKGRIMGGGVQAAKSVAACELGSPYGVHTLVNVGTTGKARQVIADLERQLELPKRNEKKITMALASLARKGKRQGLSAGERQTVAKLAKISRDTAIGEARLQKLRRHLAEEAAGEEHEPVCVAVERTVHEGTVVVVKGFQHRAKETRNEKGAFVLNTDVWQVEFRAQGEAPES